MLSGGALRSIKIKGEMIKMLIDEKKKMLEDSIPVEVMKQYKIQICNLYAKISYLCTAINLFTDAYAMFEVSKEYKCAQLTFAPSKSEFQSKYREVKGLIIDQTFYLPEAKSYYDEKKYQNEWSNYLKVSKEAVRVLEKFIQDKKLDFENEMYWETEIIKYKVYSLNY